MSRPVRCVLLALVSVMVVTSVTVAGRRAGAGDGCAAAAAAAMSTDERVVSGDGTSIAITVFRPSDVCAEHPTPVVLAAHPWGGSRWTTATLEDRGRRGRALRALLGAGYGVVAVDARGHGDSGGRSRFHHPVSGVADFRAVVDRVAGLDWVEHDGGDPELAVLGASFGGAITLLLAAADARVDAAVPMVTWSDLPHSIAPDGRVRAEVIDALLSKVSSSGARVDPELLADLGRARASGVLPPALATQFAMSSPSRVLGSVHVPVYLVHGLDDRVFAFDEAVATYTRLRSRGVETRLLGYRGGHVEPDVFPSVAALAGDTCASHIEVVAFLNAALRGDAEARAVLASTPPVTVAREDGTCWSGAIPAVVSAQAPFSIGTPTSEPHSVHDPS